LKLYIYGDAFIVKDQAVGQTSGCCIMSMYLPTRHFQKQFLAKRTNTILVRLGSTWIFMFQELKISLKGFHFRITWNHTQEYDDSTKETFRNDLQQCHQTWKRHQNVCIKS